MALILICIKHNRDDASKDYSGSHLFRKAEPDASIVQPVKRRVFVLFSRYNTKESISKYFCFLRLLDRASS